MADPRVYPSDNGPAYHVDYSSDMSGEMPPGGGQTRYNYSSGSSGEMPRQPNSKPANQSKPDLSGEMLIPRNPMKQQVIQIPKDQVFHMPPPQNARLQKIYAARAARKRNRSCCCFLKYLLLTILFLLLVIILAAGLFYILYKPKIPKYTISSLSVNKFNISMPNTFIFAPDFEATVTAENPNSKISIYYEVGSHITVYYKDVSLANGAWPKFYQPENNVTKLVVPVNGSGIRLSTLIHDDILRNQKSGAIPLNLDMKVPVKIKAGSITTWTINVFVSCDVTVDKLAVGSTIVNKSCSVKVHVFNKF
jgi:Late embryogenesis abundant protein